MGLRESEASIRTCGPSLHRSDGVLRGRRGRPHESPQPERDPGAPGAFAPLEDGRGRPRPVGAVPPAGAVAFVPGIPGLLGSVRPPVSRGAGRVQSAPVGRPDSRDGTPSIRERPVSGGAIRPPRATEARRGGSEIEVARSRAAADRRAPPSGGLALFPHPRGRQALRDAHPGPRPAAARGDRPRDEGGGRRGRRGRRLFPDASGAGPVCESGRASANGSPRAATCS